MLVFVKVLKNSAWVFVKNLRSSEGLKLIVEVSVVEESQNRGLTYFVMACCAVCFFGDVLLTV